MASYDLLVIGAGAAGSTAATTAASNGARVALVERDKMGGTCLNYGCDPTKTLLHIAHMLYQARHAETYGLQIPQANVAWDKVQDYVKQVITTIRGGTPDEANAAMRKQGIAVLEGEASFVSPHEVTIAGEKVTAERIIIASGSQTVVPPIEGLADAGFLTNVEAIALPTLPKRMAIIGGGAIGVEFAQMFQRFGVQITIVEQSAHILDKEDRELAALLRDLLSKEGIRFKTGTALQRVERTDGGKRLTLKHEQDGQEELLVDEVLLAIGRRPTLEKLNLEAAGVKTTKKGIVVDEYLRSSTPHIWAAGDVASPYQFTHVAYEQGKLAAQNAFSQQAQAFDNRVIPWVTYTTPALAHVGQTEEQLREAGIDYKVSRMKFSEVERAISQGQTDGMVKLLVDQQDKILGAHILGARADDLLAPLLIAMQNNLSVEAIASTIFPYPTLGEGVRWAADRV
jgi:dihydrolipoamide dehydrogenase